MPRVLVLSRNYPNEAMPDLGPWVEGLVRHLSGACELRVVAPVPYCPPLPSAVPQTAFRRVPPSARRHGIAISHPRFLTGPGYSLHSFEAGSYLHCIRRHVDRLRAEFCFDLIHAHFSYPDGVVAACLGERYDVPVVITEHAPWLPWMREYPRVRRQAVRASALGAAHIAVSRWVRDTIARFVARPERLAVIPVGFDRSVFGLAPGTSAWQPKQILYVGRIHTTKGVDLLLAALRRLLNRRVGLRLVLVGGGSTYGHYRREEGRLRQRAHDLGLSRQVEFVGPKPPHEVAALMRTSALLVLPSRAESFGAVLVEALACGTPVVATRCGGPEDIVGDEVGRLVACEDADALAAGIDLVLSRRDRYAPGCLNRYALDRFSWQGIAERTRAVYGEALAERGHVLA